MNSAQQNYEIQEKLKAAAGYNLAQGCTVGMLEPARPSLFERVAGDVARAQRESVKFERLLELQHLLEKNPEVARILDLVELVRG